MSEPVHAALLTRRWCIFPMARLRRVPGKHLQPCGRPARWVCAAGIVGVRAADTASCVSLDANGILRSTSSPKQSAQPRLWAKQKAQGPPRGFGAQHLRSPRLPQHRNTALPHRITLTARVLCIRENLPFWSERVIGADNNKTLQRSPVAQSPPAAPVTALTCGSPFWVVLCGRNPCWPVVERASPAARRQH